jgi:hypothetical protein
MYDLELMHHFCIYNIDRLSYQEDARDIWKTKITQEAYAYRFVMHGILSLSALHKAHLLPGKRSGYLARAAYHHNISQESFKTLILDVTRDNWRPVFCFAIIVIGYVSSLPLETDSYSLTALSQTLA